MKLIRIIIIIVVTVIAGTIGRQIAKSLFRQNPSFDKQLMKVAEEINKNCPFLVDSETQLDSTIGGPGDNFTYKYTLINYSINEIDSEEFISLLKPNLINMIKTSKDLEIFRKNLITMNYKYYDKNGIFLGEIKITPKDYD